MNGFYVGTVKSPLPRPKATALLLGPCLTHEEALNHLERARIFVLAELADPDASSALFGVLPKRSKPGEPLPLGKFNARLDFTPDKKFGFAPTI